MAKPLKISETSPFRDTVFYIRTIVHSDVPDALKMRNIEGVMDEFHEVIKKVQSRKIVPPSELPREE